MIIDAIIHALDICSLPLEPKNDIKEKVWYFGSGNTKSGLLKGDGKNRPHRGS
jgi:hypothetical protein